MARADTPGSRHRPWASAFGSSILYLLCIRHRSACTLISPELTFMAFRMSRSFLRERTSISSASLSADGDATDLARGSEEQQELSAMSEPADDTRRTAGGSPWGASCSDA